MEQKFEYNSSYDWKTHTYKHFKNWWDAVGYAQAYKMSLKYFMIVKVEDHYEIHQNGKQGVQKCVNR